VEYLEKRVHGLEGELEEIMEAIMHGRITELKQETEEKEDLKNQLEDNKSDLSDAPQNSSMEMTVKWTHIKWRRLK
jgi:hypothetical protein